MFKFQREVLTYELAKEFEPLSRNQFKEMKHDWDGEFPYNPDREMFIELEQNDRLRFYTCRKKGKIIGYSCYFLLNGLQSKDQMQAICEMIYLNKEERGIGGMGIAFIDWCDRELERQVDIIIYTVKPFEDYSRVLKHFGYKLFETNYARRTNAASKRVSDKRIVE